MRKIIQSEKGLTLIEVIISLTILLVMTLAISSLIGVVSNGKRMAEQKQEAMLLGQQVMEELQLVENIHKVSMGYELQLSTVGSLRNNQSTEEGGYQLTSDQYTVNVELRRNIDVTESLSNEVDFGIILDIKQEGNMFRVTKRGEESKSILIDGSSRGNLTIDYYKDNDNFKFRVFTEPVIIVANDEKINHTNILLSFDENFEPANPLPILIFNQSESNLSFYFQNLSSNSSYLSIEGETRGITFYNDFIEKEELKGDLFEIRVQIKQQDKVLFETYGNKKFKIKG